MRSRSPRIRDIAGRLLVRRLVVLLTLFLLPAAIAIFVTVRMRYAEFGASEMSSFAERLDQRASGLLSMNQERARLFKQFIRLSPAGDLDTPQARSFALSVLNNAILSGQGDVLGAALCTEQRILRASLTPPINDATLLQNADAFLTKLCQAGVWGNADRVLLDDKGPYSLVAAVAFEFLFFSSEAKSSPTGSHQRMMIVTVQSPRFLDDSWMSTYMRLNSLGMQGRYKIGSEAEGPRMLISRLTHFYSKNSLYAIENPDGNPLLVRGRLFAERMWEELFAILAGFAAVVAFAIYFAIKRTNQALEEAFRSIDELNRDIAELGRESFEASLIKDSPEEIASIRQSVESLRQRVLAYGEQLRRTEGDRAIAQTTQMLAHDVRKPLGMARTLINMLRRASRSQIQQILESELPNLEEAQRKVDAMLSDIIAIGTETQVSPTDIPIESLMELALMEVFRPSQHTIELTYDFRHQKLLKVDPMKVTRIFSNIVANAAQAIEGNGGESGKIWFRTQDRVSDGKAFVEICIGNTGSYISHQELTEIFQVFYTKGKKKGTGLGLAIAKKFVTAHEGRIWCTSSRERGVEFHFTLPASDQAAPLSRLALPSTSAVYNGRQVTEMARDEDEEAGLEKELVELIGGLSENLRLLIVDDEEFYRNAIKALLERAQSVRPYLSLDETAHFAEVLPKVMSFRPHVCLTDLDLGVYSESGFDLVQRIKKSGLVGTICVHSNHFLPGDSKQAFQMGADTFLPKPLTMVHLLKLLTLAARTELDRRAAVRA